MTKTPEWLAWRGLRARCYDPRVRNFCNYGGRGIRVCERWLAEDGFNNFLADMGKKPSQSHSLDRIDVNGDYSPENCRWATFLEQCRNRRSTRVFEYLGQKLTTEEWAKRFGIPPGTLAGRLGRGWPIADALTMPAGTWRASKRGIKSVRATQADVDWFMHVQ